MTFCSDLHLEGSPPSGRRQTRDEWRASQVSVLRQIRDAAGEGDRVPVAVAGDIFNVYNPSPEIINLAVQHLPAVVYAVPGQHDLPFHRSQDMDKSGYGVLVRAGRIVHLTPGVVDCVVAGVRLRGYGWGQKLDPTGVDDYPGPNVAVIHHLVWQQGAGYPGAPQDSHAEKIAERMKGFDLVVAGDQHVGFYRADLSPGVVNCGCPFKRTRADAGREPCVWVLHDTGHVERVAIDDDPEWHDGDADLHAAADPEGFVRAVKELAAGSADFEGRANELARQYGDEVRAAVARCLAAVRAKEVK